MFINKELESDSGLFPYEISNKINEFSFPKTKVLPSNREVPFLDKLKKDRTVEEKEEFWKLQSFHYGL